MTKWFDFQRNSFFLLILIFFTGFSITKHKKEYIRIIIQLVMARCGCEVITGIHFDCLRLL